MNTTLKSFFKKYNNASLDDAGCYVSEEYAKYQSDLKRTMTKFAESIGAKVNSFTKGHYCESIVFERNGKFAYLHHEGLDRTLIRLDADYRFSDWYARTMAHAKDWTGGCNINNVSFENLEDTINGLLR